MIGEVFHHVVDGLERGDVKALNRMRGQQVLRLERLDHLASFFYLPLQQSLQSAARNRPLLCEFKIAIANIHFAAQSRDDPLVDITGEVQREISSAVGRVIRAPPHALFRKPVKALGDTRQMMLFKRMPRLIQERAEKRSRFNWAASRLRNLISASASLFHCGSSQ